MGENVSFCGRELSGGELDLIRQVLKDFPNLSQSELALTICELLEWRRPNGGLKSRECLEFLRKLEGRGAVPELPERRQTKPLRPHRFQADASGDAGAPLKGRLADFQPVQMQLITEAGGRRLFQQYVERYHPLGYQVPYGAQLRYFARRQNPPGHILACLLFTSAAWRMAPRDEWIGWNDEAREANLPLVVNNARFLILPWVEVPHLASHILALASRQLPGDWLEAYGQRPVLLETLVDRPYQGTCYRAANWILVGRTQGRGRMDRLNEAKLTRKDILLYPLAEDCRRRLCQPPPPSPAVRPAPPVLVPEPPPRSAPRRTSPPLRPPLAATTAQA